WSRRGSNRAQRPFSFHHRQRCSRRPPTPARRRPSAGRSGAAETPAPWLPRGATGLKPAKPLLKVLDGLLLTGGKSLKRLYALLVRFPALDDDGRQLVVIHRLQAFAVGHEFGYHLLN